MNTLFNRVIMDSGAYDDAFRTPEETNATLTQYLAAVGCSSGDQNEILTCLLDMPANNLTAKQNNFNWRPTIQQNTITIL